MINVFLCTLTNDVKTDYNKQNVSYFAELTDRHRAFTHELISTWRIISSQHLTYRKKLKTTKTLLSVLLLYFLSKQFQKNLHSSIFHPFSLRLLSLYHLFRLREWRKEYRQISLDYVSAISIYTLSFLNKLINKLI